MTKQNTKRERIVSAGTVLPDGTLVEAIFDPHTNTTAFLVGDQNKQFLRSEVILSDGTQLLPPSPHNNLIKHGVLLLPSGPQEYGAEDVLLWCIEAYIKRYCDLPEDFVKTAAAYIMLSWVYDRFNELPYLRLSGTFGTGKTRFLLTVGSLAYRPIFASGASTVAPIFHSLSKYRGTLVMDEADFRFSDEKADVTKILNNGNVKGFPILRCVKSKSGEFDPEAYNVYGPKIVATRGSYEDPALESRFITEKAQVKSVASHIPVNLPQDQQLEALSLRNQLLLFRFRNWHRTDIRPDLHDYNVQGRVGQIFRPLLSVVYATKDRDIVARVAMTSQESVRASRENRLEVRTLQILTSLSACKQPLTLKAICEELASRYGYSVSSRSLGHIIRNKLGLATQKRNGIYVVSGLDANTLNELMTTYGVSSEAASAKPEIETTEGCLSDTNVPKVPDIPKRAYIAESKIAP